MKPFLVAVVISSASVAAQAQTPGQPIRARDGDVILVENNDKVRVVQRRQANVRVVYNAAEQWVIVLADWLSVPGGGDGVVDMSFSFRPLRGAWPLGERWEGAAFIDQYSTVAGPNRGIGLTTAAGLIQVLHPPSDATFADPSALASLTSGGGGSASERASFDVAEQRAMARVAQEARGEPVTVGSGSFRTSTGVNIVGATASGDSPPPSQPVRVGGSLRPPVKIKDVPGVMPDAARRAGVFGTVVLDIVIGTDGKVQNAKVLRSIALLDQAAIDAVMQWVYEPSQLNGRPVAVIMSAAVDFR